MANEDIHRRLDDLHKSMENHFRQDFEGFGQISEKLDKIDDKLDNRLERLTRLEEKQAAMSGKIKLILSLIVSSISAGAAWLLKYVFGGGH